MKGFSRIVVALCVVATKSTFALRHAAQNGAMVALGEPDSVAEAIETVDSVMAAIQESVKTMDNMIAHLSTRSEGFVDDVCQGVNEESQCQESVRTYVSRCMQHDCFKIDNERYPAEKEYQPLALPNPYQLDAAFQLFKECDSNATKEPIDEFLMRFKHGGRYGAYQSFIMNVVTSSYTQLSDHSEVEDLVNRYLYMATMYYKTYLILDTTKAHLINKIDFAHHIFGKSIKHMLEKIIRNHLPKDFGIYSIERLSHISAGYGDYILKQVPHMPAFSTRFNSMVVDTLHKIIGKYQKMPWYKKWFNSVADFFKNSIGKPIKNLFSKRAPSSSTEGPWHKKVTHSVKKMLNEKIPVVKNFFKDGIRKSSLGDLLHGPKASSMKEDEVPLTEAMETNESSGENLRGTGMDSAKGEFV
uniref:Rhoptry-associated protein 1 n=1 Tax=Babesia divergens TaxID=32595 RepID=L7NJI1_BABDI|nr:rhoptry-associated protein 1 [Babesia divergens]AEP32235.1 rhoptry-associated protein 1 [Babesia divergens]AEP32237.1 rhoptry-associated protein 1 [Babesia divergens]